MIVSTGLKNYVDSWSQGVDNSFHTLHMPKSKEKSEFW